MEEILNSFNVCACSHYAQILKELGIPVIDADQVARDIVKPGTPALKEIVAIFGSELVSSVCLFFWAELTREQFC